jgi:NADH dehydrogenase FAD-containing subunit
MAEIKNTHIVILGAGYAGILASLRLANQTRRTPVDITLINAASDFVERIRLHQVIVGQSLKQHPIPQILKGTGVRFIQAKVTDIAPDAHRLTLQAADGGEQTVSYDTLVYALGSRTNTALITGAAQHTVTLDAALGWSAELKAVAERGGQVVVIGGGLTGLEGASEIAEAYPKANIHLITRGRLGSDLNSAGETYLRKTLNQLRITVHENSAIRAIEAGRVIFSEGESLPFDLCVTAVGFTAPTLARQAGLAVNSNHQVIVDSTFRSVSHPDIFAIGDCATFEADAELSLRMGCAVAMPMAYHAANVLAAMLKGEAPEPFAFGFLVRMMSLGRRRGLVQFVDAYDQPTSRVLTGRAGAMFKETICRGTVIALYLERRIPGLYMWSRARKAQGKLRPVRGLLAKA